MHFKEKQKLFGSHESGDPEIPLKSKYVNILTLQYKCRPSGNSSLNADRFMNPPDEWRLHWNDDAANSEGSIKDTRLELRNG